MEAITPNENAPADGVRTNYFDAPLSRMLGPTLRLQSTSQWPAAAELLRWARYAREQIANSAV